MRSELFLTVFMLTVYTRADFSDRVRKTTVKLFENVATDVKENFVISPFSIWTLMTLLSFEAGGESRAQIKRALYLPKRKMTQTGYLNLTTTVMIPDESVTLLMKNFLFLSKDLEISKDFDKRMKKHNASRTVAKFLDFSSSTQTALEANNIIKEYTNLSNVLSEKDFEESKMVLTNTVLFKGLWSLPFNQTETMVDSFFDEDGTEIGKVNMMHQKRELPYSNMNEIQARVLELPYGNDRRFCMLVILPFPDVPIKNVYESFQEVTFKDIFAKLKSDEDEFDLVDVDVKMPRFKINTNMLLNKVLMDMGMNDIFEPGVADFQKITAEKIYISSIVHKAVIEVTESGTDASASTTADFSNRIGTPEFIANKPFIYLVMEKPTATVLFCGIYSQPTLF